MWRQYVPLKVGINIKVDMMLQSRRPTLAFFMCLHHGIFFNFFEDIHIPELYA
jgi:hypothetical protein